MLVKETQCTHCLHKDVCSLKQDFLAAQEAVDGVIIDVATGKKLIDVDWIYKPCLKCTHYVFERGNGNFVRGES